eukprot:891007-Karenia_brevis.AAC.1
MLDPYRRPPVCEPRQQTPAPFALLAHLEVLLQYKNKLVVNVVVSALLVAYGTLRYKHLGSVFLASLTSFLLVGVCTTNKVNDKSTGLRNGFIFTVPRFGITGIDV